MHTARNHVDVEALKPGDILSRSSIMKVLEVGPDNVEIVNAYGKKWTICKSIIEAECNDSRSDCTRKVGVTQLAHILQNNHAGDLVRCVFTKKPTAGDGQAKLREFLAAHAGKSVDDIPKRALSSIVSAIKTGERREMLCTVIGMDDMGRLRVIDQELALATGDIDAAGRLVDPRSLEEVTMRGVTWKSKR